MITLSIGRTRASDIVVSHPSVSTTHAEVAYVPENNTYTITDTDSSNGTYVNGVRIVEKQISAEDQIAFGAYQMSATELQEMVDDRYFEQKTDFSLEFSNLMPEFVAFEAAKKKLNSPSKWPYLIGIGMALLLFLIFKFVLAIDFDFRILITAAITIPALMGRLLTNHSKRKEKLELLLYEYENKLLCPKCKSKLFKRSLKIWQTKSSCDNSKCNATF